MVIDDLAGFGFSLSGCSIAYLFLVYTANHVKLWVLTKAMSCSAAPVI